MSHNLFNLNICSNISEFEALRDEWNQLLSKTAADTIFLTWEWLYSWWESYSDDNFKLYIITVRESTNKLIGIMPFYVLNKFSFNVLKIRELRFIGDGSSDSDYLDFIIIKGSEKEVINSAVGYLLQRSKEWDILELSCIPENSPNIDILIDLINSKSLICKSSKTPCAYTMLPPTWDEFQGKLQSRFRTKVRTTIKTLEKAHKVNLLPISSNEELVSMLGVLFELHEKRWKMKGQAGSFQNNSRRTFYELFSREFLNKGWLVLDFLEVDDRKVASQICFRYNNSLYLLQEGFEPDFADMSVGIALRALVLKRAIDEGITCYDFLAGVGRHKTQWAADIKHCITLSIAVSNIKNRIYFGVPHVIENAKERINTILPNALLERVRRV